MTSCFKCGAAGSSYHPSKRCTRSFSPCDKCDPNSDIRYTHSTNFHGMATNRMRKPPSVTCWRCGGAHLSNSCKVPCRCDTCGKDDHTTAYHDLYEQIKNRRAVGALDATARLQL